MGPSLNFPCGRGTFRQHSLLLENHPSTFLASVGLSVNFRECSVHPWDFTSILHASVNFRQLSVHPGKLCQLSLYLRYLQRTSVNFLCICGIIHQVLVHLRDIPSTFRASTGPSVNLRELYVQPRNLPSTFHAAAGPSVNFHQHLYILGNFH